MHLQVFSPKYFTKATALQEALQWKMSLTCKNVSFSESSPKKSNISLICDRACENRACGLKYTMSFDETYLNTEM